MLFIQFSGNDHFGLLCFTPHTSSPYLSYNNQTHSIDFCSFSMAPKLCRESLSYHLVQAEDCLLQASKDHLLKVSGRAQSAAHQCLQSMNAISNSATVSDLLLYSHLQASSSRNIEKDLTRYHKMSCHKLSELLKLSRGTPNSNLLPKLNCSTDLLHRATFHSHADPLSLPDNFHNNLTIQHYLYIHHPRREPHSSGPALPCHPKATSPSSHFHLDHTPPGNPY